MSSTVKEKFTFDADNDLDANGFWTTKARFARPGVQVYAREEFADWPESAKIEGYYARVLRPESVVFDPAAMKTFENLPVSVEHGANGGEFVTPDNALWSIVGAAGAPVVRETSGGIEMLTVPVTLYDRDAIEKARSGERKELSAGYYLDVEYAPGKDEKYGEYDYILKSWRGNHITLTRAGKAGPEFYIGDKKMTVTKDEKAEVLVTRALDGINYQFGEQAAQIFDRVLGERDAARAELKKAQDQVLTEEKIEKMVNDRIQLRENLQKVKDFYPALDTKGKSAEYIQALLDAAATKPADKKEEGGEYRAFTNSANDSETTGGLVAARANFINKNSGRRN